MPLTLSDSDLAALASYFAQVAATLETVDQMIGVDLSERRHMAGESLKESVLQLRLETAELTARLRLPIHRDN
jgi:hypothetical protein